MNMNNAIKLFSAVAVIALFGLGCAKPEAPRPAGSSRIAPASATMTVRITADGEFEPTTAFVKKGTVVTFENGSEKSHSIVPKEDAGKSFDGLGSEGDIGPGGKFSVTMDETGRWLYADGTNLAFSGAIEVIE
jgi:plastocyanin